MTMKKCLACLMAVLMLLSLVACADTPDAGDSTTTTGNGGDTVGSTTTSAGDPEGTTDTTVGTGSGQSAGKSTTTTTKAQASSGGSEDSIGKSLVIKQGAKKMEDGLNFGGKIFTMACGVPPTDEVERHIEAFQKEFKCRIKVEQLDFAQYTQQVVSKIASGSTYDLIQLEGSRYPQMILANTCEPIEDVITTADWTNKAKPTEGGFSEELSMAFAWDNHLYGVLGTRGMYAPQCNLIWYNKKLLKEAGADDPRELYEAGKWNFDAMKKIGTDVVQNTKAKLCSMSGMYGNLVPANGGWYIKYGENGTQPKANITNSRVTNALQYLQSLATGNNAVVDVYNNYDHVSFFQGKTAFWVGAPYHLSMNNEIAKNVEKSNAFGKSLSNLGVAPMPMGPDNAEKAYGTGWLYAFGAGKGTADKRVAVAWAKFATYYNDTVKDAYEWSAEDQKMIDSLTAGPIIYRNYSFADASNNSAGLISTMEFEIVKGEQDLSQIITVYNALIQNCIDVNLRG